MSETDYKNYLMRQQQMEDDSLVQEEDEQPNQDREEDDNLLELGEQDPTKQESSELKDSIAQKAEEVHSVMIAQQKAAQKVKEAEDQAKKAAEHEK